VIAGDWGQ